MRALVIEDDAIHGDAETHDHERRERRRRLAIPLEGTGCSGWLVITPNCVVIKVLESGSFALAVDDGQPGPRLHAKYCKDQPSGKAICEMDLDSKVWRPLVMPYILEQERHFSVSNIVKLLFEAKPTPTDKPAT